MKHLNYAFEEEIISTALEEIKDDF